MQEKPNKDQFINLALEFDKYKTLPTATYLRRKPYEPLNPKAMTAFIPGVVRKIFVKEKKKVTKGEVLLILDAMKMNNNIFAPFTGVIKKIYVKEGDMVTKNQVLIEMR
ncbi:MAG: acetyl-CoA carboxylase biotin carboxyl carrier protein subunit [Bacteroidales bacterium]